MRKQQTIGNVAQTRCRSYSSLEFDGCPACADAALEATEQAAMYILGRAAVGLSDQGGPDIRMSYTLNVRLMDDDGVTIASDEVSAEQSIGTVPEEDDLTSEPDEDEGADLEDGEHETSMRLEDFQTVMDRLELAPLGRRGLCGKIGGRLYGFERSIGRFEVDVAPAG